MSGLKSYLKKWCHTPTLSLEIRIMHQKDDQQFAKLVNRLCIGKQTNDDLRILQSRKVTQEQFETLHHITHFFPTRRKVESYNESVLESSSQYTLTITAIDFAPSDILASAKENLQAAIKRGSISPDWMPIFAQKRTFLVKSVWVTWVQFPFCHAAVWTIHVAQSATFKSIYIDM